MDEKFEKIEEKINRIHVDLRQIDSRLSRVEGKLDIPSPTYSRRRNRKRYK